MESEDDKAGRKVGPPDEYHIEYVEDHSLKDHVGSYFLMMFSLVILFVFNVGQQQTTFSIEVNALLS